MTDKINHPVYLSIRYGLKCIVRLVFWLKGFRVIGRGNLPRKRTASILICNHAAFVDSVYLIASLGPRFTICGAKPKYFSKWPIRQVFRIANILKVENHDQFVRDCASLLRSGEIILIYPEMGRNPDQMGPFRTWAAEVALAENVRAIPCYLVGTTREQTGKKQLIVGSPVEPKGDPASLTKIYRRKIEMLKSDIP